MAGAGQDVESEVAAALGSRRAGGEDGTDESGQAAVEGGRRSVRLGHLA